MPCSKGRLRLWALGRFISAWNRETEIFDERFGSITTLEKAFLENAPEERRRVSVDSIQRYHDAYIPVSYERGVCLGRMEFVNAREGERDVPTEEEDEEEKVTSSMENIIPVRHLSHGWKVLQGFAQVYQTLLERWFLTSPPYCPHSLSLFLPPLESVPCDDG